LSFYKELGSEGSFYSNLTTPHRSGAYSWYQRCACAGKRPCV